MFRSLIGFRLSLIARRDFFVLPFRDFHPGTSRRSPQGRSTRVTRLESDWLGVFADASLVRTFPP
jgi:hypothetical protein